MPRKPTWDKFSIKAEIGRRGQSLASLSEQAGLNRTDVAVALERPFPKAEMVIAAFLDVPLHELWPDRWDEEGCRIRYIRKPVRRPLTKAAQNRINQALRRGANLREVTG